MRRAVLLSDVLRVVEEEYPLLPCPCCEGQGAHLEECTFETDSNEDYERLEVEWHRQACILARLGKL